MDAQGVLHSPHWFLCFVDAPSAARSSPSCPHKATSVQTTCRRTTSSSLNMLSISSKASTAPCSWKEAACFSARRRYSIGSRFRFHCQRVLLRAVFPKTPFATARASVLAPSEATIRNRETSKILRLFVWIFRRIMIVHYREHLFDVRLFVLAVPNSGGRARPRNKGCNRFARTLTGS